MNKEEKIDNAILGLVFAILFMLSGIMHRDVQRLKNIEPEVVTITETEYVEVEKECEKCLAAATDEVAMAETRISRGEAEPVIHEEVVEEVVDAPPLEEEVEPTIQPIDYNFDVMTPSNFTSEDLARALDTESHQGLLHLVDYFVEAEQTYGVNSLYLMSTLGWESGWGRYRANTNNLAGWKNNNNIGFRAFESEYECIMTVARNISTNYKDIVGTTLGAVTKRYCPDPSYTENIISIMSERQNKILY